MSILFCVLTVKQNRKTVWTERQGRDENHSENSNTFFETVYIRRKRRHNNRVCGLVNTL